MSDEVRAKLACQHGYFQEHTITLVEHTGAAVEGWGTYGSGTSTTQVCPGGREVRLRSLAGKNIQGIDTTHIYVEVPDDER